MHQTIHLVFALGLLAVSGCTTLNEGLEAEVVNSIRYDDTPCPQLIGERNALAAQYGLSQTVKRTPATESRFMGVGPLIPDLRAEEVRQRNLAIGQIDAMNRSLTRRACIGDAAAT
jgi:hypothetical protein